MANEKLIGAVQLALAAGAAGTMVPVDAPLAQEKGAQSTEGVPLEEIVVTGSRIRRVDAETASPVFVLDAATIAQSGATTMGDLVNKIPSIAGQAVNPALNNGGGFGEAYIDMR